MLENAIMQIPAGFEWVLIIVAVVIVFFGVKKIPEFARSFGKAKGEFEKAKMEADKEIGELKRQAAGETNPR